MIVKPRKGERKGTPCVKCEGTGLNEHGGSWRSYSHWYDDGKYGNASKAEKSKLREFLSREHAGWWALAVAESGQKHVLSFAPLNYGDRSGTVAFESALVEFPGNSILVESMTSVLTAGATKAELESGEFGQRTWRESDAQVRTFERAWSKERGTGWFALALWLAQREE